MLPRAVSRLHLPVCDNLHLSWLEELSLKQLDRLSLVAKPPCLLTISRLVQYSVALPQPIGGLHGERRQAAETLPRFGGGLSPIGGGALGGLPGAVSHAGGTPWNTTLLSYYVLVLIDRVMEAAS